MGEMVLAGAFASWYWTFNKDDTPSLPLLSSIGRYRIHHNSIAYLVGFFNIVVCSKLLFNISFLKGFTLPFGNSCIWLTDYSNHSNDPNHDRICGEQT